MTSVTESLIYYAQKITKVGSDDFYVEILSRFHPSIVPSHASIEAFFQSLTAQDRFEIFAQQNQLADQLFDAAGIKCSVNIDNTIVESEDLRNKALDLIKASSAPTTYEFTETNPMPSPDLMNPFFEILRSCGKRSGLDDFGTGFNGMSLFVDYDFDAVKIDRSLIIDIENRPGKLKVLALISQMIEALGKEHIVEGIETNRN